MKNKLNGRDFITIGIFNAIGIVIYMAVAFAMASLGLGDYWKFDSLAGFGGETLLLCTSTDRLQVGY